MQTQLEKHLRNLENPAAPPDLKSRCLSTIPVAGAAHSASFQKTRRPFMLQRVAIAGAFLFAAVAGVSFWNTRPPIKDSGEPSGSVAFAQTMEAFQKVSFGHVQGRDMEAGILRQGWHASDFFRTEMWFDSGRGLYRTRRASRSNTRPTIAGGTSSQSLFLPDGTSYYRRANSPVLLVTSSQSHWASSKKSFISLLAGLWGNRAHSPSVGQWKGKAVQLFHSEAEPSPQDQKAMPGVTRMRTFLYVNPATKLPVAFQDFVIYGDKVARLTTEYEFDFSRPGASRFDPAPLQKGAIIEHGREAG